MTTENELMSRAEAEDAIQALRATLTPGSKADDMLAFVTRDLWDGYPVEDAYATLDAASHHLPADVTRAVRALLDRIEDEDNNENEEL